MQGNLTFTSSSSQTKLLFQTHQKQSGCRLNQFPANCTSFAMTTVSLSATGTPTQPTVALQKNQKPNILLSQIICLQHIKANSHGQFFYLLALLYWILRLTFWPEFHVQLGSRLYEQLPPTHALTEAICLCPSGCHDIWNVLDSVHAKLDRIRKYASARGGKPHCNWNQMYRMINREAGITRSARAWIWRLQFCSYARDKAPSCVSLCVCLQTASHQRWPDPLFSDFNKSLIQGNGDVSVRVWGGARVHRDKSRNIKSVGWWGGESGVRDR